MSASAHPAWPDTAARVALGFSAVIPGIELWRIEVSAETPKFLVAVVATVLYLPLHLRHVYYALHGRRSRAAVSTFALMAVVMLGGWVLIGQVWVFMLASLIVSMLCTLPTVIAVAGTAVVVAAPLAYDWHPSLVPDAPYGGLYLALALTFRSTCLFVVVWLVSVSRRLSEMRAAVSAAAVQEERVQMQDDLQRTLGGRLTELAELAARSETLAASRDPAASTSLEHLVATSRATLSDVKRIVDAYQRVSARAQLEAVEVLLNGAGIDAAMVRDAQRRGGFVLPAQIGGRDADP